MVLVYLCLYSKDRVLAGASRLCAGPARPSALAGMFASAERSHIGLAKRLLPSSSSCSGSFAFCDGSSEVGKTLSKGCPSIESPYLSIVSSIFLRYVGWLKVFKWTKLPVAHYQIGTFDWLEVGVLVVSLKLVRLEQ